MTSTPIEAECIACGRTIRPGTQFCPKCGQSQSARYVENEDEIETSVDSEVALHSDSIADSTIDDPQASPDDDRESDRIVADLNESPQRIPAVRILRIIVLFSVANEFDLLPSLLSLPIFVAILFVSDLFIQKCMALLHTRDFRLLFFPRLATDHPEPRGEHRTRLTVLALLMPVLFIALGACFMTIGILLPHVLITETAMICAFLAAAQSTPLPGCAANRLLTRILYSRWNWLQVPITLLVAGPPAYFNLTRGFIMLGLAFLGMIIFAAIETNQRRIARRASISDMPTEDASLSIQGHRVSVLVLSKIVQALPKIQRVQPGKAYLDSVAKVVDQSRIRPPKPVASIALLGAYFVVALAAPVLVIAIPFSSDEAYPFHRARFEVGLYDGQPMHLAAAAGRPAWIESAVEAGVEVNPRDKRGATPLYWAVERGHYDTAESLLDHGADLSIPTAYGKTCLMEAAVRGDVRLVELLIDRGADPFRGDGDGKSAADYAEINPNHNTREKIQAALIGDSGQEET